MRFHWIWGGGGGGGGGELAILSPFQKYFSHIKMMEVC